MTRKHKKVALVTGGFDPLHKGHIKYFEAAKKDSDLLVVGLNSDEWLLKKKGYYFLPWKERSLIISSLSVVDDIISFDDEDNTAIDAINICLTRYKKVVFMNGGDRTNENIPELNKFDSKDVEFRFGIGGNKKINSSSSLLDKFYENMKSNKRNLTVAPWGTHEIIYESKKNYKIKKIIVSVNESLSLQFHKHRSEHWIIVQGKCQVQVDDTMQSLEEGDYVYIPKLSVHRIKNISKKIKLIFIEVNIGNYIEEDDIVRLDDKYGRTTLNDST